MILVRYYRFLKVCPVDPSIWHLHKNGRKIIAWLIPKCISASIQRSHFEELDIHLINDNNIFSLCHWAHNCTFVLTFKSFVSISVVQCPYAQKRAMFYYKLPVKLSLTCFGQSIHLETKFLKVKLECHLLEHHLLKPCRGKVFLLNTIWRGENFYFPATSFLGKLFFQLESKYFIEVDCSGIF